MSSRHLVDPELRDFFDSLPKFDLADNTVSIIRSLEASFIQSVDVPDNVRKEEIFIPGFDGSPKVRCILYRPADPIKPAPAYIHMHGGGMVLGSADFSNARCAEICVRLGVIVISVDYRLAPENPFPAALHDCYAALAYAHTSAKILGIDVERIAVGGESAGGGLAASLSSFARDRGAYEICHQHLIYPMLDDRTGQEGLPKNADIGEYCWTREYNVYGWKSYLGSASPKAAYVPARIEDLSGLPSTWIGVGDLDLFLPENQKFADRLTNANVPATLNIYPGAPHGFLLCDDAKISQKFERDYLQALGMGLGETSLN